MATAPKEKSALKEWLNSSQYAGSIRRFSEALGVPQKTAEDWFYRGSQPSPQNKMKIYLSTGLIEYAPQNEAEKEVLTKIHSAEVANVSNHAEILLTLLSRLTEELEFFKEAHPESREILRKRLDGQYIAYVANLLQMMLNEKRFQDWVTMSGFLGLTTMSRAKNDSRKRHRSSRQPS